MIFLIGPGGVGKTTLGPILADQIGYKFCDLDEYFCENVANIGDYISKHGYAAYVVQNSKCFFEILDRNDQKIVMALSSGFLIAQEEVETVHKNRDAIKNGVAVLLTPDPCDTKAVDIVVPRQLAKKYGFKHETEYEKFTSRISVYRQLERFAFSRVHILLP